MKRLWTYVASLAPFKDDAEHADWIEWAESCVEAYRKELGKSPHIAKTNFSHFIIPAEARKTRMHCRCGCGKMFVPENGAIFIEGHKTMLVDQLLGMPDGTVEKVFDQQCKELHSEKPMSWAADKIGGEIVGLAIQEASQGIADAGMIKQEEVIRDLVGDERYQITCMCGCGETFLSVNKDAEYKWGHKMRAKGLEPKRRIAGSVGKKGSNTARSIELETVRYDDATKLALRGAKIKLEAIVKEIDECDAASAKCSEEIAALEHKIEALASQRDTAIDRQLKLQMTIQHLEVLVN